MGPAIPGFWATSQFEETGSKPSAHWTRKSPHTTMIDANGLIVAPGFIDIHSHSDMTLLEDGIRPEQDPPRGHDRNLGRGYLGRSPKGKRPPHSTTYGGRATYLDDSGRLLRRARDAKASPSMSPATLGWARCSIVCRATRSLGRDGPRLNEMKVLLDEAMNDGAIGLSTMLASPGEFAVKTQDLVALCQVVNDMAACFRHTFAMRGSNVFESVKEAITVGRSAGVPVDIIHLKIADKSLWGRMKDIVRLIDRSEE